MNQLKLNDVDKAIIRQCGKNARERYETNGTSLKKIVVNWLRDNNFEVEDLKYSLIFLRINDKKILCTISTCTSDRNNKNYTIGKETADNYKEKWIALFAEINGDNIISLKVADKEKVDAIVKNYPRSSGNGTYYACSYSDVNKHSDDFDKWIESV